MGNPPEDWRWDEVLKRDVYPASESEIGEKLPLDASHPNSVRDWLLAAENRARIQHHLTRYFTADYSGRHFEWFCEQSSSMYFSPWDVLAIETLSVGLPPQTVRWLLEPDAARDQLIEEIRPIASAGMNLWECDVSWLRSGGALSDLYELLQTKNGFGYVTTSKLMAAKFPRLVPIRDSRVEVLLDMKGKTDWWEPIRQLFLGSDGDLATYLTEGFAISDDVGEVTALRRLDVILWMESRARDQLPDIIRTPGNQRQS